MQQAMASAASSGAGSRSQHMASAGVNSQDGTPPISGTSYANMRADEIIKKYHHSNTDVQ